MNCNKQTKNTNFNICIDDLIDVMTHDKWGKTELTEFTIKFDGEAVKTNEMNADELATSLLGLSTALQESNIVLNGHSKMFVKVKSNFNPGSFEVDIVTLFTSNGINAAINIAQLIGFTGAVGISLIELFRYTKGKKIDTKKQISGNNYEITVNNSDSPIIINGDVLTTYEDATVREALNRTVSPLNNQKMSEIVFLEGGKECEKITRDEREYFTLLDKESINEIEGIDYFLITQANFEGAQTGWRLSFGESALPNKNKNDFPVKILDDAFLKRVRLKKIILNSKNTIIKAKYKKITQKIKNLRVSWEIIEILNIEHDDGKDQDGLDKFFESIQ